MHQPRYAGAGIATRNFGFGGSIVNLVAVLSVAVGGGCRPGAAGVQAGVQAAAAPADAAVAADLAVLEGRDPALWPFAVESPWNTPLGSGAVYAGADDPCTRDVREGAHGSWINARDWSHPVYLARETDPLVGIYRSGVKVASVRSPVAAQPALPVAPDADAHLHIVEPGRRYVDEMWRARRRRDGGWDVQGYTRNDLYGLGVLAGGERAYGGSALGGLIRVGELQAGIRHALAFSQPRARQRRGPVWPALHEDAFARGSYRGHVPLGQLVALPKDLDLARLGLSPTGLSVARALQDYGAYNVDSSDDFSLTAEPALEEELTQARDDLTRLRPHLTCVKNNRPETPGGGGTPRAPRAPALRPPR